VTKATTDAERAQLIAAEVSTYQIANKASFSDAYDHIARHKPELFQLASAE
jgi:hypothetical protein